jgi:type VI protein secretion system component VasK
VTLSSKEFREGMRLVRYWLAVSIILNLLTFSLILATWNWGGEHDLDTIAISITALEVILAIVAVGGFWLLQGAARESARERAEEVAREVAEPVARRTAAQMIDPAAGDDDSRLRNALDANEGGRDG